MEIKRPKYKFIEKMDLRELEKLVDDSVNEGYDLISFEVSGDNALHRSFVAVLVDATKT